MKITLRILSLFFGLMLWSITAWAQPANDHCVDAVALIVYDSEAEAVLVEGDTRNSTDGALANIPVCSANFYRDDVWFCVTAPAIVSETGYAIKVYYNDLPTDMEAFGIALYNSCDALPANTAIFCANTPGDDQASICLQAGQKIFIRVWSASGDAVNWQDGWGTFRIAVFPRQFTGDNTSNILWGELPGQGDFDGGLNEWTLEGMSCNGTPAENALWEWTATGFPFYVFGGEVVGAIKSRTFCNGSVIFDSGFLQFGIDGVAGSGPCPWFDHEGALTSPIIDLSGFSVAGISLLFNQSMQRFSQGLHFIDYSIDGGTTWTTIEINEEKTYLSTNPATGGGYFNEEYRVRLPGAENASMFRVRFRFAGGAYWWVIDDVRIIETEANNIRVQDNFYAIAPFASIPSNQVFPFGALADVLNVGASPQTNVVLNHMVYNTNTQEVIYNEDLAYGTIDPDFLAENRLNPELIMLPKVSAEYMATYTLTQDQVDFDPIDNEISFNYTVGGDMFALEDGATRSVAVANGVYDAGAPLSYGYGNYFRSVEDVEVERIMWGVANANDMVGKTVQIYLLQWTDTNNDRIAESSERKFIGVAEHTFDGTEGEPAILEAILENFENPGAPIMMRGGFGYIAIVEYQASVADDPQFFLLASEARDFGAQVLAMDTAQAWGLVDFRFYSSVLAFSSDGNIANIDYEVTELNPNDNRIFFGHDIVPLVRIITKIVNTKEELPFPNLITAYPNPAVDQVQVKLEFTKPYSDVKLRLLDNLGKVVYYKSIEQLVTQHIESIHVGSLPSGNYMLQVETPDGQRSIPLVVVK